MARQLTALRFAIHFCARYTDLGNHSDSSGAGGRAFKSPRPEHIDNKAVTLQHKPYIERTASGLYWAYSS